MRTPTPAERFATIRAYGFPMQTESGAVLRSCSPHGLALLSAPARPAQTVQPSGRTWTLSEARRALGIF